jgi:hypothetical protein
MSDKKLKFCILEQDHKSFTYMTRLITYIEEFENFQLSSFGNILQSEEIEDHLRRHGFKLESREAVLESLNWIDKYGERFRIYLNTLMVAYLLYISHRDETNDDELTFDTFRLIAKELNETNAKKILNYIF